MAQYIREAYGGAPEDTGCALYPGKCVECPREEGCIYDEARVSKLEARNRAVLEAFEGGTDIPDLAQKYGLSVRSVYRLLQSGRRKQ